MSFVGDIRSLPRLSRRLLLLSLVNNMGTGLIMPFLVVYAREVRGLDITVATTALAVFSGAAMLGAPVAGWFADRSGARPVALASMVVQAVGFGGYAFAAQDYQFVATAVVAGLGVGGLAAWHTMLAQSAPAGMTSVVFSLDYSAGSAAIGLSGAVGAWVVSVSHPVSFQVLYLADAASCLIVAAVLAITEVGGEDPAGRTAHPRTGQERAKAPTASYAVVYRDPAFLALLLMGGVLLASTFAQLESGLPAYLTGTAGVTPSQLGAVFAVNTVAVVVSQALLHGFLKRSRPFRLIATAAALWAVAWSLVLVGSDLHGPVARLALLGPAMAAFGVAATCFVAGMPTLVNSLAPDGAQGRFNAAWSFAKSFGFICGPLTAGAFIGVGQGTVYLVALAVICAALGGVFLTANSWLRAPAAQASETARPRLKPTATTQNP